MKEGTEIGSGSCETVRVAADNEQGHILINKSDFDEEAHTLWQEPSPVALEGGAVAVESASKEAAVAAPWKK